MAVTSPFTLKVFTKESKIQGVRGFVHVCLVAHSACYVQKYRQKDWIQICFVLDLIFL